jgi:hypothetical protein
MEMQTTHPVILQPEIIELAETTHNEARIEPNAEGHNVSYSCGRCPPDPKDTPYS